MTQRKTPFEEIIGVREDSATRLMREMLDSPAERLRRDTKGILGDQILRDNLAKNALLGIEESAGAKYVRDMQEKLLNDPIQRHYDQQIADAKALMIADPRITSLNRQMDEISALVTKSAAMQALDDELARAKASFFGSPEFLALDKQIEETKARLVADLDFSMIDANEKFDAFGLRSFGADERATLDSYRGLLSMGSIGGSLIGEYETIARQNKLFGDPVLGPLTGNLSDLARTNQWATALDAAGPAGLNDLFRGAAASDEITRIQQTVFGYTQGSDALERARLSSTLGLFHSAETGLSVTRLKLSAFAGASDIFGFQARTSESAYQELFGHWSTRPDLPPRFWSDPAKRRRMYDEAEVDPGLIESDPRAAIEVVIESGFTAGVADENQSVALLDISGVSMSVRSVSISTDAYRALIVFEQGLRLFIAGKLAAAAGPNWAKQRIDGLVHAKAKQNRAAAIAGGETDTAILAYIDLGELLGIMTRKDNWDQVFGHIFPNRQRFEFDMQALVAIRRPTMHARKIDSVRLVEMLCVMRRLNQYIASEGAWESIANADD